MSTGRDLQLRDPVEPGIDVRPSSGRFRTRLGWLDSHHSFSFGPHYDPLNTGHGLLIVSNDDLVAPGGGFSSHPHRDMEILTWVLSGALEHCDSSGHEGVITPGLAQRMSAGSGIVHSEMNHSRSEPVHFVQMWVVPDRRGIAPDYEQVDVSELLASGELIAVASGGRNDAAVAINQDAATMWAGRLESGSAHALPDAAFVHLYVARGAVLLNDRHTLGAGDAARLTRAGETSITVLESAETIVWESQKEPGPR